MAKGNRDRGDMAMFAASFTHDKRGRYRGYTRVNHMIQLSLQVKDLPRSNKPRLHGRAGTELERKLCT